MLGVTEKPIHLKLKYAADSTGIGFYWPESEQKRQEILSVARGSPADFEAVYQGRPGRREGSIFLSKDLNAFYTPPIDLSLGAQSPYVSAFIRKGHSVVQAWDTAFSTSSQSAYTVCVTALLVPCNNYHCNEDASICGPCDYHFDVLILDVFRKRLDWGDLTSALKTQYYRWRPEHVFIEKKASGISLIQSMQNSDLPIQGVSAVDSKGARALNSIGIQSAGSVQGWFRQHRVLIPDSYEHWIDPWLAEMKDFSGNDDASSDQVDATVHLVTQAILMGSSMAVLPSGWTPERSAIPQRLADMGYADEDTMDPRLGDLLFISQLPEQSEDPFYGTCGRCAHNRVNFCPIQNRRMLALDSCVRFTDVRDAADPSAAFPTFA